MLLLLVESVISKILLKKST